MNWPLAKHVGLQFLRGFSRGQLDGSFGLYALGATWHFQSTLHDPAVVPVRHAVPFLMDALVGGFDPASGYSVELDNCIVEGDEAAIEYRATGNARTGQIHANRYLVRFTVTDGKIVSIRPYFAAISLVGFCTILTRITDSD